MVIVASRASDPHSLDPADEITVGGGLESQVAFYERLVDVDAEAKFKPALAESWQITADAKTYTFKLRRASNSMMVRISMRLPSALPGSVLWPSRALRPSTGRVSKMFRS